MSINPSLHLFNIHACIKFGGILSICPQNIEQKNLGQSSDIRFIVWMNSITNVQKMKCNSLNLYLVNITAYTNLGEILSICCEDIEQK